MHAATCWPPTVQTSNVIHTRSRCRLTFDWNQNTTTGQVVENAAALAVESLNLGVVSQPRRTATPSWNH